MKLLFPYFSSIVLIIALFCTFNCDAQVYRIGNGNPIVPGYFADPTIKKFGDTWYCYATTDGIKLASGDPQVWISKDFKNWYNYKMDLPKITENVWAPDVVVGPDNRYYLYYSSCLKGCSIYGYVSDTPIGPWTCLTSDDSPLIAPGFMDPVIPLDPHVFRDDDGSYWIYFCTWAIYKGHGVGWAKMNPDMKTFSDKGIIPNTDLPDVFEAPYMLKKDGVYFLMYSSGSTHNGTYRVQYATSDKPNGKFTVGQNNPITVSTDDGTIDAPGHHSVFEENGEYYIAYHRHDNPHSTGGLVRQVCVDRLQINGTSIEKVKLSHEGIGLLGPDQNPHKNLARGAVVTASSSYTDVVNKYTYRPEKAVDDNNGTIWKAGCGSMGAWLQVDLGVVQKVRRVFTEFEYPTFYYQYKIDHSTDGKKWLTYADRRRNKQCGSPMVDEGDVDARFFRITITGVQKVGLFPAIWNFKVFSEKSDFVPMENTPQSEAVPDIKRGNEIISINAAKLKTGTVSTVPNKGTLTGTFEANADLKVEMVKGRKAITFTGKEHMKLSKNAPVSISWNSPFTISTWVLNPDISESECIIVWSNRNGLLGTYAAVGYGLNKDFGAVAHWDYPDMGFSKIPQANEWHHIVVTFDGGVEKIYVDGKLDNQEQKSLYVDAGAPIYIGWSTDDREYFSGSIASLSMYDYALDEKAVERLSNAENER